MSEFINFQTGDGGRVTVEMADGTGVRRVGRGGVAEVGRRFGDLLGEIESAAADALDAFRSHRLNPDQIEIEFGVKINAEAGAVIAKTATEGHLIVKLSWGPEKPR